MIDGGKYVRLTRHLSAEERNNIDTASTDDVRPYRRICVGIDGWLRMLEIQPRLVEISDLLMDSVPITYQLELGSNVFLKIEPGSFHVNIRQYFKPANQDVVHPTRTGVTLKPVEFCKLMRCLGAVVGKEEKHVDEVVDEESDRDDEDADEIMCDETQRETDDVESD